MYIPNLADAKRWNDVEVKYRQGEDEQWTLITEVFAAEANRVVDIEDAFVALLQEAGIRD